MDKTLEQLLDKLFQMAIEMSQLRQALKEKTEALDACEKARLEPGE